MSTENQDHIQAPECFSIIMGNRNTATAVRDEALGIPVVCTIHSRVVETSVTSVTNETARAVSTGILYSLDTASAVLDRVIRGLIKDYGSLER